VDKEVADDPCVTRLKFKYVPTCHHCSKVGHIRPNCFTLKPREPLSDSSYSRDSHEGLFNMMRVVMTRLDKLETMVFKVTCQALVLRKEWVSTRNTIHHLR
jgi:hypothetical protein